MNISRKAAKNAKKNNLLNSFNRRYRQVMMSLCFLAGLAMAGGVWAQTQADSGRAGMTVDSRLRGNDTGGRGNDTGGVKSQGSPAGASRDEGELIELEEVQIHGEIAQPNVAITVSRAEPLFREITLERTPSEAMSDIDLSGLREGMPGPEKINDWKELVNRPRR
jgi:hypothetical protein